MTKIEQLDRDAAAAFAAQTSGAAISDPSVMACIRGDMDNSIVVQHFARHRIEVQKTILDLVERHAKAKQYSPAPYTDIMGEIAKIREKLG